MARLARHQLAWFFLALLLFATGANGGERETLDGWKTQLDQVQAALQRDGLRDQDLAGLRDLIEPIWLGARAMAAQLAPRVQTIQSQLGEDGNKADDSDTAPAASDPAAQSVTQSLETLQAALRDSRFIAACAEDLTLQIQDRRRAMLLRQLLQRSESILSPKLWTQAADGLSSLRQSLSFLGLDWWSLIRMRDPRLAFGGMALALLLGGAVLGPVRRLLLRLTRRDAAVAAPSLLRKAIAAAWFALLAGAAPAVAVGLVHVTLTSLDLVPFRLMELFRTLTMAAGVAGLIHGLAGGLLAPSRASWRLAPFGDAAAARLLRIASTIGMLGAAAFVGGQFLRVLVAPISLTAVGGSLVAVVMALLTMLALKTVAGGILRPADQVNGLVRWGWIIPVLWGAAVLSLVGTLAGYVAFGLFLVSQIVWASTVLALLYVLLIVTDELFSAGLKADARLARAVGAGMGLSGAAVEQVGVVVSGLLRLLLIAVGVLLVLAPWGIESGDVLGWLQAAVIGVTVGQVTISPGAILGGLALFLLGILATRAVQRWLDAKFLPRTRLDVGLRTSIGTGVGYMGVLLAALVGVSYIGLNLGNLAIVAGALSVGIGFGLQSIVNNFVSGLILLAERPIKAGDWIVVGSDQGFVKRINVRATEIETFDRASVIIPNSNLISGVVKNWMHADTTGRVVIPVGVAYDSDPERVRSLLLGCAEDHASVLVYPEPRVFFKNFGESSLAFELICFVGDVTQSARVASDLHFAILKRLRQDGIEIPFAQRELRLRDIDRLEAIAERLGRPRRSIPVAVPAE